MPAIRFLACLLAAACPALYAQQIDLPLFPHRTQPVQLVNAEGVSITAIINSVRPETGSVQIVVPEQNNSAFTLQLDTFDPNSQAIIEDWFFKSIANQNLSFKVEEQSLGRTETTPAQTGLGSPPESARNIRINDQSRERAFKVEIRNSANYEQSDLDVVIGLRILRDRSPVTASEVDQRTVVTEKKGIRIASGQTVTIESTPVSLVNYSLRYDEPITVFYEDRTEIQTQRRRYHSTERIAAYYVLIYYKGELVAASVSQRYLLPELIEQEAQRQTDAKMDASATTADTAKTDAAKTGD